MKHKLICFLITFFTVLIISSQTADAQLLRGLLHYLGVKDNSAWMSVADIGDGIINASAAKKIDSAISTYGTDAENKYNQEVNNYNARKNRELQQYLSEVDQFKMEYCMKNGFYDRWFEQYGDEWFEKAGKDWFDRRNEFYISRGDNLLPWHLRGDAEENTRYNQRDDFRNTVLGSVGLSTADVQQADAWTNGDIYDKQDMIIDAAIDAFASLSPKDQELVNALGSIAKSNNQYSRDKANGQPDAVSKRNIALANIVLDAAWDKNEQRKRYVSKSLDLPSIISEAGLEEEQLNDTELAGVLMSIQRDNRTTQEEKNQWFREFGFEDPEQTVVRTIKKVTNMTDDMVAQSLQAMEQGPSSDVSSISDTPLEPGNDVGIEPVSISSDSSNGLDKPQLGQDQVVEIEKNDAYYTRHLSEILPDAEASFSDGSYNRSAELCLLHFALVDNQANDLRDKALKCARLTDEMHALIESHDIEAARKIAESILSLNPKDKEAKSFLIITSRDKVSIFD